MSPRTLLIAALVLMGALHTTGALAPRPAAGAAAAATVVSLTFDDGAVDQYEQARPLLDVRGLKATFYVNSGRVGATGYLSRAQIADLAASGHEIGGHTITHADLPTLTADEQRRQICDDRVTLLGMGFTVKSLAYPYGNADGVTRQIARDCGYNSARTVGGIVSPGSCTGCDHAETVPPDDPYYVRSPDSVRSGTTLDTLKGYVTQAERNGGGWVPLVLHHVCDDCGGEYRVGPALLASFLDWLKARPGISVRTVDQVVGGELKPPVPGPGSPTQVQNPSLESAANNVPVCFQLGGYGANTHVWTRTGDAHSGAYAQRVEITSHTDGDRKLVTRQDAGGCAPAAVPGRAYDLSVWYKGSWASGIRVKMSVFYRSSSGTWTFWTNGPALPPASSWTRTTVTTPPVPAGATNVSFGLALAGPGVLTVDDFSLDPR